MYFKINILSFSFPPFLILSVFFLLFSFPVKYRLLFFNVID